MPFTRAGKDPLRPRPLLQKLAQETMQSIDQNCTSQEVTWSSASVFWLPILSRGPSSIFRPPREKQIKVHPSSLSPAPHTQELKMLWLCCFLLWMDTLAAADGKWKVLIYFAIVIQLACLKIKAVVIIFWAFFLATLSWRLVENEKFSPLRIASH